MAVASGVCPNCGSRIEFRGGASLSIVCAFCKHVVVRTDRDLQNLGRVADVAFSDASLAPGDRGTFRGRSFSVEGRLVLQHPAGGTWEEYYALFDGRNPTWISEAQGFWQVVSAAQIVAPPLGSLRPQHPLNLGPHGTFIVQEANTATFLSAEGELPFAARPGEPRTFVDASGPDGRWASIDYGNGQATPQVFVGVQATFAEFQIQQRGGDRPATKVATGAITCLGCGAPLPVLAAGTERAACRHCNALNDIKLQKVVAQQQKSREIPGIELGTEGTLPTADARGIANAKWTVLAYIERSTGILGADEWFGWQEYLLYNVGHGYRWLVFDEGTFYFVTPLAAGDVDASRASTFVRMRNVHFRRRNAQQARVDYVLGEVYWKVEVGETVFAQDFECGREILSSEQNANEVSWSHGVVVPTPVITQAFGYKPKVSAYGTAPAGLGRGCVGVIIAVVALLILGGISASCGSCNDEDDSPSSSGVRGVGGVGVGGFGGK